MEVSEDDYSSEEVRGLILNTVSLLREEMLTKKSLRPISKAHFKDPTSNKDFFLKKVDFLMKVLENPDFIEDAPGEDLPPWKCRVVGEVQKRNRTFLMRQRGMLTCLLNEIKRSIDSNLSLNRREIYYKNPLLFKDTIVISQAVNFFSAALEVPPWKLGIIASAKGLIQGPLTIVLENEQEIDCRPPKGTLIPHCIFNGVSFKTEAKYVLILEKDTIFQKLIEEDFSSRHGPCILVTGKGFPDVVARFFLRTLFDQLTLPMFLIADGDPYGMDIMFTYRFGSRAYERWADSLVVPEIQWLGVFPRNIGNLSINPTELSPVDIRRVKGLLERHYVQENSKFLEEVQFFMRDQRKCETEDLCKIASHFLADVFIPSNIIKRRFF